VKQQNEGADHAGFEGRCESWNNSEQNRETRSEMTSAGQISEAGAIREPRRHHSGRGIQIRKMRET
jgi:hypothetical protein